MEVSSGEEYYIASDNTGTPLAVFSSNGQMIKQVTHKVNLKMYGRLYIRNLWLNCVVKQHKICIQKRLLASAELKASLYETLNPSPSEAELRITQNKLTLLVSHRCSTQPTEKCTWTLTQSSSWWSVSMAAFTTP